MQVWLFDNVLQSNNADALHHGQKIGTPLFSMP